MKADAIVSFHLLPSLHAEERILHLQPWLWAVSGKSLPSYRFSVGVPFLQDISLCVTDQRVLLSGWLLRLLRVDWTGWFAVEDTSADRDRVTEVSVGRAPLFGQYLQLLTHNPVGHWWRSPEARIRLFMRNPEPLCRMLQQRLPAGEPAGSAQGDV